MDEPQLAEAAASECELKGLLRHVGRVPQAKKTIAAFLNNPAHRKAARRDRPLMAVKKRSPDLGA